MREPKPSAIARLFLANVLAVTKGQRRIHLSVFTASRRVLPTIRYEWRLGNMFGVSFWRRERALAEAWLIAAITAGYQPLYHFRKRGSGHSFYEVKIFAGWPDVDLRAAREPVLASPRRAAP